MTQTEPTRAAIYARYSGPEQQSFVRRQVEACRRLASSLGATVAQVYLDGVPTCPAVAERQAMRRLIEVAKTGNFDIVLVESPDRISRDPATLAAFEYACSLPVHCAEAQIAPVIRQVACRKAAKARLAAIGLDRRFPLRGQDTEARSHRPRCGPQPVPRGLPGRRRLRGGRPRPQLSRARRRACAPGGVK
jgi:hypothetical protein